MTNHWLGEIRIFPYDSLPEGWTPCEGQVLPIDPDNRALFSLLGTAFGGNGWATFALPDLRGKVPVGTERYNIPLGTIAPSPSSAATPKEKQATITLVYAICIDGFYPSSE